MNHLEPATTAVRAALHERTYPGDLGELYLLCGELTALLRGLESLTIRLSARVADLAADPALGSDNGADARLSAEGAANSFETAARRIAAAGFGVNQGWQKLAHLYLDTEGVR